MWNVIQVQTKGNLLLINSINSFKNKTSIEFYDIVKSFNPSYTRMKNMGVEPPLEFTKPLPKVAPLVAQKFKKRDEDLKLQKFISLFNILRINLPLAEALFGMSSYAMSMK